MKTPRTILMLATASIMAAATNPLAAAGYSKAEITRLHNDVKVLKENAAPKTASVGQQIDPVTSVATGTGSRAELRFPDKSLTRLGANSRFTLRGDSRTLDLDQGVMLLQVPEQIRGAKVRTAAVTAAVTGGTALMEYLPGGFIKIIVIEGFVDIFMNSSPSNFKTFSAGQMLIMKADGTFIPDGVDVDLKALLKTSKLINGDDENGINQDLVNQAVEQQQQQIQSGELQPTNLVIPGQGTYVVINTDNSQVTNLFNQIGVGPTNPNGPQGPQGQQGGPQGLNPTGPQGPNPAFQGFNPLISGNTILNSSATIQTNPHISGARNVDANRNITVLNQAQGAIYRRLNDTVNNRAGNAVPLQYFTFGNFSGPDLEELLPEGTAAGNEYWAVFKFEHLFINGTPVWSTPPLNGTGPVITNVVLASKNGINLGPNSKFTTEEEPSLDEAPSSETVDGATLNLDPNCYYENTIDHLLLYADTGDINIRSKSGWGKKAIYGYNQDVSIIAASLSADVNISGNIVLESGVSEGEGGDEEEVYGPYNPSSLTVYAGKDINVTNATTKADEIRMEAGKNVNLQGAKVKAEKGNLTVKAGYKINITNSSQLKAMMNSETLMRIEAGGDGTANCVAINLDNVRLDSSGKIELLANTGSITMNCVTSSSDFFKATTLSPNGWITIGNSNISATTLLELFGGTGSGGGVKFVNNTTLNSATVNISGYTIEIKNGKCVNVPQGVLNILNNTNRKFNRSDDLETPHVNYKGTFKVGSGGGASS